MKVSPSFSQPHRPPMTPSASQSVPQPQLPNAAPSDSIHFQGIGGSKQSSDIEKTEKMPLLTPKAKRSETQTSNKATQPTAEKKQPTSVWQDKDPATRQWLMSHIN